MNNLHHEKVSIIVPIYNVQKYIARCVQSLIDQKHENIEIILVDDGSTDDSGAIIEQYAKIDRRIHIVHKENGGVSDARNNGLQMATGDYVMFVDGDDYVGKDYVSYFLGLITECGSDIAMNVANFTLAGEPHNRVGSGRLITAEKAMEQIYLGGIFVAVWNKMYKKSFLDDHNLTFDPDIWYGEGMLFNIRCLQYTERVAIGSHKVYYQEYNPSSAMRSFKLENQFCGLRSMELQKQAWNRTDKRLENAWKFHCWCYAYTILSGLLRTDTVGEQKTLYQKCRFALRKHIRLPLLVALPIKQKLYWTAVALCPEGMAKRAERRHIQRINKAENAITQRDERPL